MDNLACARVATLLGSLLTALSSGTNYAYSAYAPQLGSRLHITHTQLNIIALSGNMGVYTTGPILGRLTDKRGPRPVLLAACLLLFAGYMGIRIYYDAGTPKGEAISLTSLIVVSIFSYMTGVGGNCGLAASINATAKSFPERMRATTVGLVLSGFGLSAFFFSSLANWLFPGNTSSLLLFFSLATSLPVIIGYMTIRPVPHAERPDPGPGGLTFPPEPDATDSSTHLLGQEAMVDVVPDETAVAEMRPELTPSGGTSRCSVELSPSRASPVNKRRSPLGGSTGRGKLGALGNHIDTHGKRLLIGWEFWLLFTILSLLSGTGLMYMNNVGSITQALFSKGNPDFDRVKAMKLQAAQVSVISLANCAGRIMIGASADFAKSHLAMHRSYLLSLISVLLIISQLVGSQVENVYHLWQASFILGLGYGCIFGLLPTITIEWFGLSHFSENWGFVSLGPLIGGNLFSIFFGRNLDAHIPSSTDNTFTSSAMHIRVPLEDPDTEQQCLEGRACYAGAMVMTTVACVLALFLSLVAAWRDQRWAGTENTYESVAQDVSWEEREIVIGSSL